VLAAWEKVASRAKAGVLTEEQVRRVAADMFFRATGDTVKRQTVRGFLDGWLTRKGLEMADTSASAYRQIATEFLRYLGARADRDMSLVTRDQVAAWRDSVAGRVSAATANKQMKIMRSAWNQAVRDGLLTANPFSKMDRVKDAKKDKIKRRAFTLPELRRILAAASGEWRGIILFGLYTGQRLGDIVSIRWNMIDTAEGVMRFVTQKTGMELEIPLHPVLVDCLGTVRVPKSPTAPLFPRAAEQSTSDNSKAFIEILVAAGLRNPDPKAHKARKKGRSARRMVYDTSFHAMRHTATSLLKNAGVSNVVAMDIIGHKSEAVSAVYTHIETATKRKAIDALPDITKEIGK
jgi:integrase